MRTPLVEQGVSEEAWTALIRYGHHDPDCGGGALGATCTCGYKALLREWAERLGEAVVVSDQGHQTPPRSRHGA